MNNFDTISSPTDEDPKETTQVEDTQETTPVNDSQEPALAEDAKEAALQPVNVGGMTLKKRAASARTPATPTSAPSSGRPTLRLGGGPGARPGPKPGVSKRMERFSRVMPSRDPGVRMNENIRVPEVRVIGEDGQMIGVMSPKEAIEIARAKQQDLIEIVPNAKPPVCKIMEFGKWKYEQQKKEKLAKKSSHQQLLKEIRFHPHTDTHDFEFKVRHARNFIAEGHKVKAYVQFKGREVTYKQFGEELLNNFKARMEDIAKVDQDLSMMGRMMSMVLSPGGKKKASADSKKSEGKQASKTKAAAKDEPATEPEELGPDFTESVEATEPNETEE